MAQQLNHVHSMCGKWINKRCGSVKGRLGKVQDFEWRVRITNQDDLDSRIGRNMSFETVETYCSGDMLTSCDHAVLERVNNAWKIFKKLKSFLCSKIIGLNVKGKVCEAFVKSCMKHGKETCDMSVEN